MILVNMMYSTHGFNMSCFKEGFKNLIQAKNV